MPIINQRCFGVSLASLIIFFRSLTDVQQLG
jgi:hypothetical protein